MMMMINFRWSILGSPLILGNDLTAMDADCLSIVLNKEVIALNQDPLVSRGRLVCVLQRDE